MGHRTKVLKKNERQMIEKKFKKTSLYPWLIKILQIKMTLLFHLTPIKMTKRSSNNNV